MNVNLREKKKRKYKNQRFLIADWICRQMENLFPSGYGTAPIMNHKIDKKIADTYEIFEICF